MKLLIKEYLAALKERGELDAILPDLLSEMGLHVFSRPAVGVRQNGVDLAAVGVDKDGIKKVFLFTVKPGDLKRQDWNSSPQGVRPSLDEMLDSYIPNRIPKQYTNLPVAICVSVGGDINQNVDADLSAYERRNTSKKVGFQRWDGDLLANYLLSAVLAENVISGKARTLFRKSVAMLDEPDAAYQYFTEMLQELRSELGKRQKDRVRLVRQLNLCCWVLYAWSREADNLEAPYRCSELAMLYGWDITAPYLPKTTAPAKAMRTGMNNLINLHLTIADEFVNKKLLPHAAIKDGLATAVNSRFALDVNLSLFESIGRISLTGIWIQYFIERYAGPYTDQIEQLERKRNKYTDSIIQIVNNNGVLRSPIRDDHSIEIGLACILLALRNKMDAIRDWTNLVLSASLFALQTNGAYPCVLTEYHELAEHPKRRADRDYFENATAGSTLIPTLCVWQKLSNPTGNFENIPDMIQKYISHCTMQLWVPNEASEEHLYINSENHGLAVCELPITKNCNELMEIVFAECKTSKEHFTSLTAMSLDHWPIILSACRHHRVPLPLMFWQLIDHSVAGAIN
ncbi:MAG: hypothetical protein F4073_05080 [Rhodobacteraceae bacterium]|nr:hypothetical protein [Paracoccaceae bacterium]MYF46297.1 hypothetical protein [Paracoccaceae bacterium]MYI91310.1 hypothetical protein [Paracoccaceae bacterium]